MNFFLIKKLTEITPGTQISILLSVFNLIFCIQGWKKGILFNMILSKMITQYKINIRDLNPQDPHDSLQ